MRKETKKENKMAKKAKQPKINEQNPIDSVWEVETGYVDEEGNLNLNWDKYTVLGLTLRDALTIIQENALLGNNEQVVGIRHICFVDFI